jgi:cell wall-associated NlpC family hydrolase
LAAGHAVDRGGLAPGDLVFFDSFGHVGIYVGDDEFIHAPHTGRDVAIDSLSGWYGSRFVGARRLL